MGTAAFILFLLLPGCEPGAVRGPGIAVIPRPPGAISGISVTILQKGQLMKATVAARHTNLCRQFWQREWLQGSRWGARPPLTPWYAS